MSVNIGLFSSSEKSKSSKGGPLSLENSSTLHDEDNLDISPQREPKNKTLISSYSAKSPTSPKGPGGALGTSGKSLSESIAQFGRKFSVVGMMKSVSEGGMMKSSSVGADLEGLTDGEPSDKGQTPTLVDEEKMAGEVGREGGVPYNTPYDTINNTERILLIHH